MPLSDAGVLAAAVRTRATRDLRGT